jgi:hypothetical protein
VLAKEAFRGLADTLVETDHSFTADNNCFRLVEGMVKL